MNQQDLLAIKIMVQDMQSALADIRRVQDAVKNADRDEADSFRSKSNAAREHIGVLQRVGDAYQGIKDHIIELTAAAAAFYEGENLIGQTLKTYGDFVGFNRSLDFKVGPQMRAQVESQVRSLADEVGERYGSLMPHIVELIGAGVPANKAVTDMRAFSALAASGGANSEQTNRAFLQYAQIAAMGKLQGFELHAMERDLVPILSLVRGAGLGSRVMDHEHPLTFDEIERALEKFGQRSDVGKMLAAKGAMPDAAWQRLLGALDDLKFAVGDGLAPTVVAVTNKVRLWVKELDPKLVTEKVKLWVATAEGWLTWLKANVEKLKNIGLVLASLYAAWKLFDMGKELGEFFKWVGKVTGIMKTVSTAAADVAVTNLATAATLAADALDRLAASATVGGGAAGGAGAAGAAGGAAVGVAKSVMYQIGLYVGSIWELLAAGVGIADAVAAMGVGAVVALSAVVAALAAGIGYLIQKYILEPLGAYDWTQAVIDYIVQHWPGSAYNAGPATVGDMNSHGGRRAGGSYDHVPGGRQPSAVSQRRSDPVRAASEATANGIRHAVA